MIWWVVGVAGYLAAGWGLLLLIARHTKEPGDPLSSLGVLILWPPILSLLAIFGLGWIVAKSTDWAAGPMVPKESDVEWRERWVYRSPAAPKRPDGPAPKK